MNILGVTHPVSYNSAACILINGKLIAFAEEERFNRIKHSIHFPANKSVDYCLKKAGLTLKDIDYIAIGYDKFSNVLRSDLVGKFLGVQKRINTSDLIEDIKKKENQKIFSIFLSAVRYFINYYQGFSRLPFNISDKRIIYVRHHIAHCASAFFFSPFDKACIISADGGGGQEAGLLAVGKGKEIKVINSIPSIDSLGNLYSDFTELLGFKKHDGEGKVMGLSAYGNKNAKLFPFVSFKNGLAKIDHQKMNKFLVRIKKKLKKDPLYKENANLAASLQKTLEKSYLYMGEYLYKKTGIRNFCLAGGVSLNCLANSRLLNSSFVENIFVQPVSSDAGTALGAALEVYVKKTNKRPKFTLKHVYYGPEYKNEEILKIIKKCGISSFKKYRNIEKIVAKLLAKGNIIGWFQGRMEVGPRALGNRSILVDPSKKGMKDKLNEKVKGREPWRPFAPSILEEYTDEILLDVKDSPFMILESKVKKEGLQKISQATHVNETVRPQTVSKKTNLRYWKLINEFRKMTKIPALLNTSFNLSGEPIVCSPQDAISTFYRSKIDYLVLGDYLISKKQK
ncbi:carbamoyltransferase [Patescibacteria group bacterium]